MDCMKSKMVVPKKATMKDGHHNKPVTFSQMAEKHCPSLQPDLLLLVTFPTFHVNDSELVAVVVSESCHR